MRAPSWFTPAMAVAIAAVVIAAAGSAVAAALITGRQVKDRSLTGVDIRRNSLGGTEINEARLGIVPSARRARSAGDAGTLGGRGPDAFLAADRLRTSSTPVNGNAGALILSHPATGIEVRVADNGGPQIVNVNPSTPLTISGVATLGDGQADHDGDILRVRRTIAGGGGSTFFSLSTSAPSFVDILVTRTDGSGATVNVKCQLVDTPGGATQACQAIG